MLNEITRLRYEGLLPSTVVGDTRRQLIYNYRQWKGQEFVPDSIPGKLKWSVKDPFALEEPSREEDYITLDQLKKLQKDDKKKHLPTANKNHNSSRHTLYLLKEVSHFLLSTSNHL